jgi:hypothetical protein
MKGTRMNGTRSIRRGFAAAVAITTFAALTACSTEVKPPEQNIGKIARPDGRAPHNPAKKDSGRGNFGDELGNPKLMHKKNLPAGSGTRNRLNFGDNGR